VGDSRYPGFEIAGDKRDSGYPGFEVAGDWGYLRV